MYGLPAPPLSTPRFIPTHVGRMFAIVCYPFASYGFIPTHVGRMRDDPNQLRGPPRFIPTHVGRMLGVRHRSRRHRRFIPTHVGRMRPAARQIASSAGSSPRTWGGYAYIPATDKLCCGSSPRTWGGWRRPRPTGPGCRFIPTHVGRIATTRINCADRLGSSPRTWGGSQRPESIALTASVHPHARGADAIRVLRNMIPSRFIPTHVGRMRNDPNQLRSPARFIPTHVGRIFQKEGGTQE